jgi:serine/threonine-protein kinase
MIGRRLSHYRILAELGSGATGTVYRAEDTRLGGVVALKLAHATLAGDPATRERLLRETRAAAALDHPNIVRVIDAGEADGMVYLAMPYVEGRTLRDEMRGPMPPSRVITIGRALADALDHAHGRGVIHRDVKPDNVILCRDGRVMLMDFGTAHVSGDPALAGSGAIVGTFPYVAPELLTGAVPDARSDLYALGITLHELCVGSPPFEGSPAEMLQRVARETPPMLPVTVPSPLAELIMAMLEKDPAARPADAAGVARALATMQPPATA